MPSLLRVAVVSGMRRGELAALEWGDIGLDTGTITVRRALSAGQIAPPKGRAERQVSIDLGTVEVLRSWRVRNVEEMLANGDRLAPSTRVWRGVSPDMVTKRWGKLARSVGVDARWKDATRSLSASVLVGEGVPVHVAQDRLGHAELATTMAHYIRATAVADAAAADTIAGAVFGN